MIVERYSGNPILEPNHEQFWEAEAVFNGCPAKNGKKTHLLYRALSKLHYNEFAKMKIQLSTIGIADSSDGLNFKNRRRFIVPEEEWERYGCEDPRVTYFEGKYYIFYTALSTYPFSADGIKVGVAITKDFKKLSEKHLVTPFNAKGMTIFPERVGGKIWAILTVNTDKPNSKICLRSFDTVEDIWNERLWKDWYQEYDKHAIELLKNTSDHVEVGASPIKTKFGWLVIYSYITNYFTPPSYFTIEAVLLDSTGLSHIVSKTNTPILIPQEYYERIGMVQNVVFPSGATLKKETLRVYYGGGDTFCAAADVDYQSLLDDMLGDSRKRLKFERASGNPILLPNPDKPWESRAVFNPAALYLNGEFHILYRAMGEDNTSVIGYATSKDGENITYRSSDPVYIPRESFEQKNVPNGNSGCEDPRLTVIGKKIYMCYTAYDSINSPRVALSWIYKQDFLERHWNWSKPVLIAPPGIDDKDAFIFPQKFKNRYIIVHRSGEDIDLAFRDSLDFKEGEWLEEYRWVSPRKGWWDSRKLGAAGPAVKTKSGWILLYHGVSEHGKYRVGALLLDLKNPVEIIGRTDEPIFEPETPYELEGIVNNVVFPCSTIIQKGELIIFYGGGDRVIGMAKIKVSKLLKLLKQDKR